MAVNNSLCYDEYKTDGVREAAGFVNVAEFISDVDTDIRYCSDFNFVGTRIDFYLAPIAYLTKEAAYALKGVSDCLRKEGYRIKIYDAYRPQTAVNHFKRWAEDLDATEMKRYFYPDVDKSEMFKRGYLAQKSDHSRGSSVDLTLVDIKSGQEVDMGSGFDFFGEISHSYQTSGLTQSQIDNRCILRDAMIQNGFRPLEEEWWHFTLENEPYPDTYFDFPIK